MKAFDVNGTIFEESIQNIFFNECLTITSDVPIPKFYTTDTRSQWSTDTDTRNLVSTNTNILILINLW